MEKNLDALNKEHSYLASGQIYKRIEKHVIANDTVSLNLLVTQLMEEKGIAFIDISLGKGKIIEAGKKSGTESVVRIMIQHNDNKIFKQILGEINYMISKL